MNLTNTSRECSYSEDPYEAAKLFNFALTVFIGLFGLISNTAVVAINWRIKAPKSIDIYIIFLAVTDNMVIISVSLFCLRYAYRYVLDTRVDWIAGGIAAFVGLLLKQASQFLNTAVIVLLNVDRYIQVKKTSQAKTWCTPRRARINFIFAIIAALLFTVPYVIEYTQMIQNAEAFIDPCHGHFRITTGIATDPTYKLVYGFIIYIAVLYVGPLTLLIVTNVTLISVLYKRRQWINGLRSNSATASTTAAEGGRHQLKKTEVNAIVTLVAVTLIFMACQIPDVVLQFIWRLAPQHGPTANIFAYEIVIINSSINFIIYAVTSSVFRRRIRQTCGGDGDFSSVRDSNSS